ncbi:hypothetical protein J3E69DRAFT_73714 [Trichoderma sp. SZMC 28015]
MTTTDYRSDLGPLTTTFTPPVDCTSLQFMEWDAVGRNLAVSRYCYTSLFWDLPTASVIESCFPEGFASFYNAKTVGGDHIGVYSPASICPSGHTVACAHSRNKGQSNPFSGSWEVRGDAAIWDLLRDGEIATGCCPFGYGCDQIHPAACQSRPGYTFKVTDAVKCPDSLTPYTSPVWARSAVAMKVIVVHAATTEQTATRTATSSAAISSAPTSRAPSPSVPASSVPSKSSLPKPSQGPPLAAKIAIGVAIPLVAILTGAACFFIFRYRRKRKLSQEMHELGQDARGNGGDGLETPKPELPADASMASAGSNGSAFPKAELDAARRGSGGAVELAAEVTGGGIPELYSSSSPRELDSTSKGLSVVDIVGHDVDHQHVDERSRGLWQWSDYQG